MVVVVVVVVVISIVAVVVDSIMFLGMRRRYQKRFDVLVWASAKVLRDRLGLGQHN